VVAWFASIARSASFNLRRGGGCTGISPNRNRFLLGVFSLYLSLTLSPSFCYSLLVRRLISAGAGTFLISSLIASVAAREHRHLQN